MTPIEFTIPLPSLAQVGFFGWLAAKGVFAAWICKNEFQYPIWKNRLQIQRGFHHKVQAFVRNFAVNPEWAVLKAVAFIPTWLFTGTRYADKFKPWRIRSVPAFCSICNDTGEIRIPSIWKEGAMAVRDCECKTSGYTPVEESPCSICLDTGTVGRGRPCPHCARRKERKKIEWPIHSFGFSEQSDDQNPTTFPVADFGDRKPFSVKEFNQEYFDATSKIVYKSLKNVDPLSPEKYWKSFTMDNPLSHKDGYPFFHKDEAHPLLGKDENDRDVDETPALGMLKVNYSNIKVGDTIWVRSAPKGHRLFGQGYKSIENMNGMFMLVTGVCLPFVSVQHEYHSPGSWFKNRKANDTLDVRKLDIWGNIGRLRSWGYANDDPSFPPVALNPHCVKVGDRFTLVNLNDGSDASWRGCSWEVISEPADWTEDDKKTYTEGVGFYAKPISFKTRSHSESHRFQCDQLKIVATNDEFVNATQEYLVSPT